MGRQIKHFYGFGPFCLDATERVLRREGRPVALPPKVLDTLLVLVQNSGHIVEKDDLLKAVWPDTFVEEVSLARNVSALRKVLGEDDSGSPYIETIPKRGYRFISEVRAWRDEDADLVVEHHARARFVIEEEETGRQAANGNRAGAVADLAGGAAVAQAPGQFRSDRAARFRKVALMLAAFLVVAAAAVGLYRFAGRNKPTPRPSGPFREMRLSRLTTSGKAALAAISPDGKYVAHVIKEAEGQSLWVRQVATASAVRIVPPARGEYWGLTFSPDGNYIYSVLFEGNKSETALYQMPTLGGAARRLPTDQISPITFSPGGRAFAFLNSHRESTVLAVANADGSDAHTIATRRQPDYFLPFPSGPAWSPDGKIIACASVGPDAHGRSVKVIGVRADDGAETLLTSERWDDVGQLAWLADGSGLMMTAQVPTSTSCQVWHVAYPGGELRRITNDLSEYKNLSLTADSRALAVMQTNTLSTLWVIPADDPADASRAKQTASEIGEMKSFSWTPDGRIAYISAASGQAEIWIMNADGSGRKQLTVDAGAVSDKGLSVSPDGRYIVFASNRAGNYNIWRADIGGANLRQLTGGGGEIHPRCSPDGQWVIYQQGVGNVRPTLWKAPIDGGRPAQLTETFAISPAVSPDGTMIAYYYMDQQLADSPWRIGVISADGGPPLKSFAIPATAIARALHWTADGRGLAYINNEGGVSNIYVQPFDGGPARKLTGFKTDQALAFAWSRDGKHLACARGVETSDVVLINDLK